LWSCDPDDLAFFAPLPQKQPEPLPGKIMADFETLRRMMVDGQVRTADVTQWPLIQAMLDLPREHFVPDSQAGLAYLDLDLPVGDGTRRLLKPMVLAKMLQALDISADSSVLDVGCATGYAAALMARLGASVVALEEQPQLAAKARANLAGHANVEVVEGPLVDGYRSRAPYGAILVEGAIELDPEELCRQLADGGRLICIRGSGPAGKVVIYSKNAADITPRTAFDAAGPTLPGFAKPLAFAF
jgi:protein-L-isoaspartate(D-aspartate) O-methyltransferase